MNEWLLRKSNTHPSLLETRDQQFFSSQAGMQQNQMDSSTFDQR
jgi:hypothetical protein